MGNAESSRMKDYRTYNVPLKLPMPDSREIEDRFEKVLECMNLPPDKVKVLTKYDDKKKWELICDQDKVTAKNPPSYYIERLNSYLDPTLRRKRFRKRAAESTKTLRDLEISLRTNHIGWLREFLNEENKGLDVLVNYLGFAQYALIYDPDTSSNIPSLSMSQSMGSTGELTAASNLSLRVPRSSAKISRSQTLPNRRTLKNSRTVMDRDDVHVCITCLRAIMNYQYGFNMVMAHPQCINEIALSLNNRSLRTKSLVVELLAAVCLVRGGHDIILQAFDNFKSICDEPKRFTKLMYYFRAELDNIDFMVSCMQFINIVVNSVEDMNFRVHLQHEFTLLGLDSYLEDISDTENDRLKIQIDAYLDNKFNVGNLLEDTEIKVTALERIELLEEQLLDLNEKFQEQEYENMTKIVQLEKQLSSNAHELNTLKAVKQRNNNNVPFQQATAPNNFGQTENSSKPSLSLPKLPDTESNDLGIKIKTKDANSALNKTSSNASIPAPPSSIPPPPLMSGGASGGSIPLPPGFGGIPLPPGMGGIPAPPGFGVSGVPKLPGQPGLPGGLKAKQRHQPKYRLPVLNWSALRPNQVAGTIFNELDDEAVLNELDMGDFEEMFKTKAQDSEADKQRMKKLVDAQHKRGTSLIDNTRAQNLSITLRKIGMSTDDICHAIFSYDLKTLPLEFVEMLPKFIPKDNELKAFKEYEKSGKSFDDLASEDKFMWLFGRVERLQQRLNIMIFIGNFNENILTITPQLAAIIAASMSIKSSSSLKKVLEVILAFGNYMNSSKRGAVYGFKLQSLDALIDTKSTDKKQTLLHYIANVIENYYSDIRYFYKELRYVDKASKVSLDNIMADVGSIRKGLKLTKAEYENHQHPLLKEFLQNSEEKVNKVLQDADTAQEAYQKVVEYFGETSKTMPPETFFPMVDRFINAYKKAEQDLENWKIADEKRVEKERKAQEKLEEKEQRKRDREEMKGGEQKLINELRSKQKKNRRAVESKDGAIEDNINYIKSEPYRRDDTVHRSFRKKNKIEVPRSAQMSTML